MAKIELSDEMLYYVYGKHGNPQVTFEDFKNAITGDTRYLGKLGKNLFANGVPNKAVNVYKKYAPQEISFDEFLEMIKQTPGLLDEISGRFSSFNPELTKVFKAYKAGQIDAGDLHVELNNAVDWRANYDVANEYVNLFTDIICSDDDILRGAWTFDTLNRKQRQDLARKIVDAMDKGLRLSTKVKIFYADNKKRYLPINEIKKALIRSIVEKLHGKKTKRRGFYSPKGKLIVLNKAENFVEFIALIGHEYGHFIDYKYPRLGMLGEQISFYSRETYLSSAEHGRLEYLLNPTEVSSRKIQGELRNRISAVLNEQAHKKPGLFIDSMQTVIAYIEAKMAAIRLKQNKSTKMAQKTALSEEYAKLQESLRKHKMLLAQFVAETKNTHLGIVSNRTDRD